MAKKKEDENLVDVGQVYSKSEDFVNNNGKTITFIILGALLLGIGYFLYKRMVIEPKNKEAQAKIWKAEYYFNVDSLDLALDGNNEYYGFAEIAEEYAATASGNLAKHYSGIISLRQGNFDQAISYLADCKFDDIVLESVRLGSLGDAYIEQGDIKKGLEFFNKSVSTCANDATTPIYLKKMGLAYEADGNTSAALEAYEKIKRDYKSSTEGRTIDKYIGKLEAQN